MSAPNPARRPGKGVSQTPDGPLTWLDNLITTYERLIDISSVIPGARVFRPACLTNTP